MEKKSEIEKVLTSGRKIISRRGFLKKSTNGLIGLSSLPLLKVLGCDVQYYDDPSEPGENPEEDDYHTAKGRIVIPRNNERFEEIIYDPSLEKKVYIGSQRLPFLDFLFPLLKNTSPDPSPLGLIHHFAWALDTENYLNGISHREFVTLFWDTEDRYWIAKNGLIEKNLTDTTKKIKPLIKILNFYTTNNIANTVYRTFLRDVIDDESVPLEKTVKLLNQIKYFIGEPEEAEIGLNDSHNLKPEEEDSIGSYTLQWYHEGFNEEQKPVTDEWTIDWLLPYNKPPMTIDPVSNNKYFDSVQEAMKFHLQTAIINIEYFISGVNPEEFSIQQDYGYYPDTRMVDEKLPHRLAESIFSNPSKREENDRFASYLQYNNLAYDKASFLSLIGVPAKPSK